ncbi:Bifunctional aspartate aminotransferase and L-aspartate beta-decarboxylase [Streptomyces alboniger]
MPKTTFTREEIQSYARLSPFELKDRFIRIARAAQAGKPGQKEKSSAQMLNAGRGNPNWTATGPREAFHALGYFAIEESRRVWTADDLGGMPERPGSGERFDAFVRSHPGLPGIELLHPRCVELAVTRFGFAKALVHELSDSSVGATTPFRTGCCARRADRPRLPHRELFAGTAPDPCPGGTAAMCYIFDSLVKNGVLKKGARSPCRAGVPPYRPRWVGGRPALGWGQPG